MKNYNVSSNKHTQKHKQAFVKSNVECFSIQRNLEVLNLVINSHFNVAIADMCKDLLMVHSYYLQMRESATHNMAAF